MVKIIYHILLNITLGSVIQNVKPTDGLKKDLLEILIATTKINYLKLEYKNTI